MSTTSRLAILGKRLTEKRAPGTRKAVETTGGDCWRSSGSRDSGRRREASWSGGAAECDRRPVIRRISLWSGVSRRSRDGRRQGDAPSAVTGSATRVAENQCQGQQSAVRPDTFSVAMDSWWRGLPARAWTTSLRRDGRTAGRMPTAPWEASSGVRRVPGTATGGPESSAAGSAAASATGAAPVPRRSRSPVTATVSVKDEVVSEP
jgi:hypothetical protein